MKIAKIVFDVFRWIFYLVACIIAQEKIYGIVFPEKGEAK